MNLTPVQCTIAAYVVVAVLLWGYALRLFLLSRSLKNHRR